MSLVEELRRLQREAESNDGRIQRLLNELRLLDVKLEAKRNAKKRYAAEAQEEISRLEKDIASFKELWRSVTTAAAKHLVSSPSASLSTFHYSPTMSRDRSENTGNDFERQCEQLAELRAQRQGLEELLRRATVCYPHYRITDIFDINNDLERVALARLTNTT
ncbi:hypothetical protein TcG_06678 [Trypanosoma cruzi]|nr:hypothetical protein BCY84_21478 [Trypanosoma cruzi cruzi]RNF16028.1 hypothetical protein TcG_06678 [Trypanosoma cruzi]